MNGSPLRICIAEGYATGASLHLASNYPVAVAFSAGNLLPVAKALREKLPQAQLILCADDDWQTPGNPGLRLATEAARAVGGFVAVPVFGPERAGGDTDFNDLHRSQGLEVVRAALRGAKPPRTETEPPRVELRCAEAIPVEPVRWLWEGWLTAGKLHLLAGAPGTGKTTLALALAAILSRGGHWPDGSPARAGKVLLWSGEDEAADTLVPRLLAGDAAVARVFIIGEVQSGSERRPFDPSVDIPALLQSVAQVGEVRLLIIDPLVSAVATDSHKNTEVRRALQPLVDFAETSGCAVLGITHFSKSTAGRDPLERVTGSVAFGALARLVWAAATLPEETDGGGRVLARVKSNLGPDQGGFRYHLEQTKLKACPGVFASRVHWAGPLEGNARELLAQAEALADPEERSALEEAQGFLCDLLSNGPVASKRVRAESEGAGHAWATLRRAQRRLGIEVIKEGLRGGWLWQLPPKRLMSPEEAHRLEMSPFAAKRLTPDEDVHRKTMSTFGINEPLRDMDRPATSTDEGAHHRTGMPVTHPMSTFAQAPAGDINGDDFEIF